MEVDLPDIEGGPFITTPEAGQEFQAGTSEQDLEVLPPDAAYHEMVPPHDSFKSPPAETGSEPKQAEEAQQDAMLQPEDAPQTPVLTEEENPPAAAQVRESVTQHAGQFTQGSSPHERNCFMGPPANDSQERPFDSQHTKELALRKLKYAAMTLLLASHH